MYGASYYVICKASSYLVCSCWHVIWTKQNVFGFVYEIDGQPSEHISCRHRGKRSLWKEIASEHISCMHGEDCLVHMFIEGIDGGRRFF